MWRLIHRQKTTSATDADLLQQFQRDQLEDALVTLFERYLELIYGLCLKYLGTEAGAQDAVMDIYVALRQKVPQHDIGHFKNWLFTFVRNHCLMELRRQKKSPVANLSTEFMQSEAIWHPVSEAETREAEFERLENCLGHLNVQQKTCVELFYYQGLSYKEIAEQRTETVGKVRSYIQNGRRNLKNCIEQQQELEH